MRPSFDGRRRFPSIGIHDRAQHDTAFVGAVVGCAVTPIHNGDRGAGSASHREAETKLLAPRTGPSQQSHQRDRGETCSSPETLVASCAPMHPRCAQERVGKAHRTDQAAYFQRHRRPAPANSRFPRLIGSKPRSVPTDHGVWLTIPSASRAVTTPEAGRRISTDRCCRSVVSLGPSAAGR